MKTTFKVVYPKENGSWTSVDEIKDYSGVSIFLAGPCPRDNYENDWRNSLIEYCKSSCFEGILISPTNSEYDETNEKELEIQTQWEHDMMRKCDIILFNLDKSDEHPGFTTNYECGEWFNSNKNIIIYCPKDNLKRANRYILIKAKEKDIQIIDTCIEDAIRQIMHNYIQRISIGNDLSKILMNEIDETYETIFHNKIYIDTGSNYDCAMKQLIDIRRNVKSRKLSLWK